jgi:3-oxoacyl-[acyl-carrier-protein] synthase-3
VSYVGLAATATYIPERVIVEKFGLRGKHIAAEGEHVSDMAVEAASRLLGQHDVAPGEIDVVLYFGSMWKDYPVWQAAPWIAHRLGCQHAYALEYANVSCGTPVALRLARNFLVAEPNLRNVLLVAPRAGSRTCSTTATSARASCSTSAMALLRRCSRETKATSSAARMPSRTGPSRCRSRSRRGDL